MAEASWAGLCLQRRQEEAVRSSDWCGVAARAGSGVGSEQGQRRLWHGRRRGGLGEHGLLGQRRLGTTAMASRAGKRQKWVKA
ncbi:hypothetical protein M0R45_026224 [Rubus argutus]|uniref:Uncharacterized protein n=1 Tax=Rubus argutus TaxID=59490 RepID=A0AAW1WWX8_RUBAR